MRILLTLQYLGTRYAGWQTQANATGVQQVVEEALAQLCGGETVRLHAAGRTDAGVHAAAQRAHFDLPVAIPERGVILGLNQLLPSDIRVTEARPVPDDFHARFAAKGKTYEYRIWNAEIADVFASATHAHVPQRLDVERMHAAAQRLIGKHDYAVFTVAGPEVESTVRTIASLDVIREGDVVRATTSGDGFLRFMVRRIVGSLIELGRGRLEADELWRQARWTAPAKGLILRQVHYGDLDLA